MKNVFILFFTLLVFTQLSYGELISMQDPNIHQRVKHIEPGQTLILQHIKLGHLGDVTLRLKGVKVFTKDARIRIHTPTEEMIEKPLENRYFVGTIDGQSDSHVFLGFLENGKIEGILKTPEDQRFAVRLKKHNQFELLNSNTQRVSIYDERGFSPKDFLEVPKEQLLKIPEPTGLNGTVQDYELTLAIETDYELYQLFGNVTDTTNYIAGLVGFTSSIYSDEINTQILLGELNLWTTTEDPWNANNSGCALYEVGKYWNDNNQNVDRAITHFISGKSFNAGIAWLGVLCNDEFNVNIAGLGCGLGKDTDNYGGAYGVSAGIDANFDPNNPQPVWDVVVFSHELGHNFNSPHTHCYAGIGGQANEIDECYSGEGSCYSGSTSLPGPLGAGAGTLMSYCHLLSPELNNISLTLGTDHPYGVEPERVPNRMRSHVESRASAFPACIRPVANDLIFFAGFEP